MTIKHRRLLYITFFLVFFIVAPILILYTTGYGYNFKKNKLEKTGILALDSIPRGAEIYLNNKYKDKTPSRLTRLLPDQYQVRVEKENYYPWQQKLEIQSNLTTFNKDIILFKKTLPIIKVEGEINILTDSPDQEKIVYSMKKDDLEELRLLNLKNDSSFLIKEFNPKTYDELEFIEWSPDKNKALIKKVIGGFNQYLIIDVQTLKTKELFNITRLNFEKVSWEKQDDNHLYGLKGSVLYQIDLAQNLTDAIVSDHIKDFIAKNKKIYYITQIANETFLNQAVIIDQGEIEKRKIKLPSPSEYTISFAPDNNLVLLDKKNNDLFIIRNRAFEDKEIENDIILQTQAKNINWSSDSKKLIYHTNFELWTYDFEKKHQILINRYGQTINQALWHPKNNYLILQTGKTIRAIDTYPGDIKNDVVLAEFEDINQLIIDIDGENIYFNGKIGNQQGIYQLAIQ